MKTRISFAAVAVAVILAATLPAPTRDNKVVLPFNFNKQQSLDSIERVVKLIGEHKAQLWIGHDKDITARIDRAPKFYE